QRQGDAAVAAGQVLGVGEGAVGDQQPLHLRLGEVPRDQFDGLAGADQEHGGIVRSGEAVQRQAHGGGGDRHRVDADPGVGARTLGRGEGLLEQAVELAAQGAGAARRGPGLLHLAEDLRFAQHQRVEAGGDPEQVADRLGVLVPVEIGAQVAAQAGVVGRVGGQPGSQRAAVVLGGRVQLGAVAGRQQHHLMYPRQLAQRRQGRRQRVFGKGHPFAQFDRRGLVVEADGDERHRGVGTAGCGVGSGWGRGRGRSGSCAKLPAHQAVHFTARPRRMPRTIPNRIAIACLALALALPQVAPASPPADDARPDLLEATIAGEFALQAGKLEEAARWYLQAATAARDDAGLAERATRIALLAGDDASAGEALDLWRARAPASVPMHAATLTLALRLEQADKARSELRRLLAQPGDDGWRHALVALGSGKHPALSARLLGEAVAGGQVPDRLPAWLALGGLAQRLDDPDLAERIVEEVIGRFPDEPRVALLHASQLRQDGNKAGAADILAGLAASAAGNEELRLAVAA